MTAITPYVHHPLGQRPAIQDRPTADLIGKYTNRLEDTGDFRRKCISASVAPRDDERAALERRRGELLASLEPTPDRARKVIVALLASFPSYGEDEETGRFILAACCRACAKVPTWAIEEAASRFLENRVRISWDMSKRPTPPQILAEALRCSLEAEGEIARISTILDAEIVDIETTDAERQDALDAWAKLRAGIARSNVMSERTDEEAAAERAEWAKVNKRFDAERFAAAEATRKAERATS